MKTNLLIVAASLFNCMNAAYAQTGQFVEIVSTKNTGEWRLTLDVANSNEKDLVWVDLNQNGSKDSDETIGMWEWFSYRRPRNSDRLRIYGPVGKISCSFNDIKEIHAGKNPDLQELECNYGKDLTNLDLSENKGLKKVSIYGCKLSSLKLPVGDAKLEFLDVNDNQLTELDVSGCPMLATLYCFENKLTAPAMQRLAEGIVDRSSMETSGQMFVLKTLGKSEENEMLKSAVLLAKKKNWKVKYFTGQTDYDGSDHSLYSDTLPKATLISTLKEGKEWILVMNAEEDAQKRVWIDFNGNALYDYGEEQLVFGKEVRYPLTNGKITIYGDLTKLSCKGLALSSLDVTELKNLMILDCSDNVLNSLKLLSNAKLTDLLAYKNKIDEIDLSCNPMLSNVSLNNNNLIQLSLSSNKMLQVLFVSNNALDELDVSSCPVLVSLAADNNRIKELNLSGNPMLGTLYCSQNKISSLDLSNQKELWLLSCEKNEITSLKLFDASKLKSIYCYSNRLKGEAMIELCQKLPMKEANSKGSLFIVDTKDEAEGNECLLSDVQIATGKNWNVYDFKGNENGGFNLYEGIASTIESLTKTDEGIVISYFNTQGVESTKPFKGVNIVVTKDEAGNIIKIKRIF